MVHRCQLHCHTMDPLTIESLNIEDQGKWLDFMFDMDMVMACKRTSDEIDEPMYDCTTLYAYNGDSFVIDTDYKQFFELYTIHKKLVINIEPQDDNLEL